MKFPIIIIATALAMFSAEVLGKETLRHLRNDVFDTILGPVGSSCRVRLQSKFANQLCFSRSSAWIRSCVQ